MIPIMKTYESELDEMIDVVVKLTWSHTIFCALFEKKDVDREAGECEARKAHPEFFLAMHDSLLCGFCNAIALLFKNKDNETSFCSLIKRIEGTKPDLAKKFNEQIQANNSFIKSIKVLRHEFFAHRYITKTPQEVFAEARLHLNEMKEATDFTRLIIIELAGEAGGNRKQNLETQQLSKETLRCVANDAGRVMHTFMETA